MNGSQTFHSRDGQHESAFTSVLPLQPCWFSAAPFPVTPRTRHQNRPQRRQRPRPKRRASVARVPPSRQRPRSPRPPRPTSQATPAPPPRASPLPAAMRYWQPFPVYWPHLHRHGISWQPQFAGSASSEDSDPALKDHQPLVGLHRRPEHRDRDRQHRGKTDRRRHDKGPQHPARRRALAMGQGVNQRQRGDRGRRQIVIDESDGARQRRPGQPRPEIEGENQERVGPRASR